MIETSISPFFIAAAFLILASSWTLDAIGQNPVGRNIGLALAAFWFLCFIVFCFDMVTANG